MLEAANGQPTLTMVAVRELCIASFFTARFGRMRASCGHPWHRPLPPYSLAKTLFVVVKFQPNFTILEFIIVKIALQF